MQGLFSSVWGISSLIGPALGGLITDILNWRWIFYINIPFGILSAGMLVALLKEEPEPRRHRLDILGTVSLTLAITLLLIGLLEANEAWGWTDLRTVALFGGAAAWLVVFFWQERRAEEPMLPLDLFRNRIISVAGGGAVIIGTLLFAATAFVPMFAQGVLGGTAVDAGLMIAPMSIGWPLSSTVAGRLLLRVGYRPLAITGGIFAIAGTLLLAFVDASSTRAELMTAMFVTGVGMGFMSTPYLVAVQNAVPWRQRGVATSTQQFFRTIGGALTVAILGALLNTRLQATLGGEVDVNAALDPEMRAQLGPEEVETLVSSLGQALHSVYLAFLVAAILGLAIALLFPRGGASSLAHPSESDRGEAA